MLLRAHESGRNSNVDRSHSRDRTKRWREEHSFQQGVKRVFPSCRVETPVASVVSKQTQDSEDEE